FVVCAHSTSLLFTLSLHDALPIFTRSDGLIFLLFLSIFMYYVIEIGLKNRKDTAGDPIPEDLKWGKNILITILGLAAIIFGGDLDRKSTRLNSSHVKISYAVFCLK